MTRAQKDQENIERWSLPGQDRNYLQIWVKRAEDWERMTPSELARICNIAWEAGATAEHDLIVKNMDREHGGKEVYDVVKLVAQQGDTAHQIVEYTARVFGPGLPFKRRLLLAWELIRGYH